MAVHSPGEGAVQVLDEGAAKATGIRSMRGEKVGTATSVAFLTECHTDKGLQRLSCACKLAAMELRCSGCLDGRKRSLTDLVMGVATVTIIADDASSRRGYRKQNQYNQGNV